jgi:hypothetical protein
MKRIIMLSTLSTTMALMLNLAGSSATYDGIMDQL